MKPKNTPQPLQADQDNRSRQLDPQQDAYWQSRGRPEKPESAPQAPPPPSPKKQ